MRPLCLLGVLIALFLGPSRPAPGTRGEGLDRRGKAGVGTRTYNAVPHGAYVAGANVGGGQKQQ